MFIAEGDARVMDERHSQMHLCSQVHRAALGSCAWQASWRLPNYNGSLGGGNIISIVDIDNYMGNPHMLML